jgi:hypothetical protein
MELASGSRAGAAVTKAKGRFAREKGLPEIPGGPEGSDAPEEEWDPPTDLVPDDYPIILGHEDRIFVRLAWDGPQLADFCLIQQRLIDGTWSDVVRFDCAHGSVHAHYFNRDGTEWRPKRHLKQIRNFSDIRDGYDEAYEQILSKWDDYARRF